MNRYRRNPPMSVAQIAAVARQMGKTNLAALLERGGPMADALTTEINAALEEAPVQAREAPTPSRATAPEPSRAPAGLSDREAWLELAAIVPRAFGDQPEPVQRALVEAFRQQAAA